MNAIFRHNRRWVGWFLTLALALTTSVSSASWRCLDGRPCPPGCTMMLRSGPNRSPAEPRQGLPAALRSCCPPSGAACPSAPRAVVSDCYSGCSSTPCVLRVRVYPDATTQASVSLAPDIAVALIPFVSAPVAPETTNPVFSLPLSPPRDVSARLHAPRAPPVLL